MTTTDTDKWFDFMKLAQSSLIHGQKIDDYKRNIQIAIEPSFDNSIFLQLVINEDIVQWYRTTWLRLTDARKFSDPIENLKFIAQTIQPTIKYESGTTDKKNLQDIIEFAKALSVQPQLDKWGGIILDGTHYTLTIGVESTQMIYKWHHLPDNWTDLQKLSVMLEELNKKLT